MHNEHLRKRKLHVALRESSQQFGTDLCGQAVTIFHEGRSANGILKIALGVPFFAARGLSYSGSTELSPPLPNAFVPKVSPTELLQKYCAESGA